jgi:hypothetical protein
VDGELENRNTSAVTVFGRPPKESGLDMHRHPPDLWIGCDIVAVDADRVFQDFYILDRRSGRTNPTTYRPK